jgi:hypothetical protein
MRYLSHASSRTDRVAFRPAGEMPTLARVVIRVGSPTQSKASKDAAASQHLHSSRGTGAVPACRWGRGTAPLFKCAHLVLLPH